MIRERVKERTRHQGKGKVRLRAWPESHLTVDRRVCCLCRLLSPALAEIASLKLRLLGKCSIFAVVVDVPRLLVHIALVLDWRGFGIVEKVDKLVLALVAVAPLLPPLVRCRDPLLAIVALLMCGCE